MYQLCHYCQKAYIEEDEAYCQACHSKTEPDENEWLELLALGITYEEIEEYMEAFEKLQANWKSNEKILEYLRRIPKKKGGRR